MPGILIQALAIKPFLHGIRGLFPDFLVNPKEAGFIVRRNELPELKEPVPFRTYKFVETRWFHTGIYLDLDGTATFIKLLQKLAKKGANMVQFILRWAINAVALYMH